jgi:hypothetical protein
MSDMYRFSLYWLSSHRVEVERRANEGGCKFAIAVLNTHEAALDPTTVNRRKFIAAVNDYMQEYG